MPDDQAAGLRRLLAPVQPTVLGICGVEATPMVLDLADSLSELGRRVLVIDRSRGEATIRYGRRSTYELADVLAGDLGLAGVLHDVHDGVAVLPAARGFDELALTGRFPEGLQVMLQAASRPFDVWLVNGLLPEAQAGEGDLIALSPTPAAITGAYATMKALAQARERREFRVVVHDVPSEGDARALFDSVAATARRFLAARLDYRGAIPRAQTPRERGSARRQALLRLAENLLPAAA